MDRDWREIESMLDAAAGLDDASFQAWLRHAPHGVRELLGQEPEFGGWAAEAVAQLVQSTPRLSTPCMLGHYRILRHVATGGMGEIYEALDERLHRKVAVKVLHVAGAAPVAEEARKLAALRHPNICRVFDIGHAEGLDYIVMEFLDGVPLSHRLGKGPLPLAEALAIARVIAGALGEAHRSGIVHRDIKPANILLTRNGPSLLDFGIADWVTAGASVPAGTPPYMAPEQARGVCDARSDIYSMGRVLREMAGPEAPPAVERIIESCVKAEPEERWQSTVDLAYALEYIGEPIVSAPPRRRAWIAYIAIAALIGTAAFFVGSRRAGQIGSTVLIPLRARNAAIPVPEQIAVSPDGTRFAFPAAGDAGEALIWIRKLSESRPEALPATIGASLPFWSPDGQSIGMFLGRKLQTLDLATGQLRTLTEVPGRPERAVWGSGDQILFSVTEVRKQAVIYRIRPSGGAPERVTELSSEQEEAYHHQPVLLRDGSHFLYLAYSNLDVNTGSQPGCTYLATLGSPGRTLVLRRASAIGAAGDRVFYLRERNLWSQRLDARRGRWLDEPKLEVAGAAWADISSSGLIAYLPIEDRGKPAWVDRRGRKIADLPIPEGDTVAVALSRKGDVLVARREDQSAAASLWLVRGAEAQRIGSAPGGYIFPVWSVDSRYIYFGRGRGLYRRLLTVGAKEELLLPPGAEDQVIWSFSPDSNHAYGVAYNPTLQRGYDIFRLNLRSRVRQWWSATRANETQPQVSPDGRWMAWLCEFLDRGRVCISPAANPNDISFATDGAAVEPSWGPGGDRLYFIADGFLHSMAVSFGGGKPRFEPPQPLFRCVRSSTIGATYAAAPNGDRFLVRDMFRPPPDPVLVWSPVFGSTRR